MLFALAGPGGNPRRRLVIVSDGLFRHRDEEVERCHDGLQIRDCQAVHPVLQSCNSPVGPTLREAMFTVNTGWGLSRSLGARDNCVVCIPRHAEPLPKG